MLLSLIRSHHLFSLHFFVCVVFFFFWWAICGTVQSYDFEIHAEEWKKFQKKWTHLKRRIAIVFAFCDDWIVYTPPQMYEYSLCEFGYSFELLENSSNTMFFFFQFKDLWNWVNAPITRNLWAPEIYKRFTVHSAKCGIYRSLDESLLKYSTTSYMGLLCVKLNFNWFAGAWRCQYACYVAPTPRIQYPSIYTHIAFNV